MATTLREIISTGSTQDAYALVPEASVEADDQAWFWTSAWQESIRRSVAQIEAGEGLKFDNAEDFLAALDED